jgi:hypothetical protein
VPAGLEWEYQIPTPVWSVRDKFMSITTSAKLFLIAGTQQDTVFYDDVYSFDGTNWTQEDTSGGWLAATESGVLLQYGTDFFLMSGYHGGGDYSNWSFSSPDLITWTLISGGYAPYHGRAAAGGFSYDNKMWITGGEYSFSGTQYYLNDVWYTTNGIDFTQATANADFEPRARFAYLVFNNKMWIIGGYSTGGGYFTDVWNSTDGITWTRVTNSAPFAGDSLKATEYNGYMYVHMDTVNKTWISETGENWTELTAYGDSLTARRESGLAFLSGYLYSFGGYGDAYGPADTNDVWKANVINYCLSETPTYTTTPTFTKTPRLTDTPTPTFTITETNTASPTKTITRDVTPRVTKTMTVTVVRTVTATRTVIIYTLYTPTLTPTKCCTKEYIIITPTPTHVSPWIQWGWPW